MGCRSTSCHLQCGAFVRSHNEKTHCSPAHLERNRATFAENLQVKQARRHGVRLTDFGTPQRIAGTMGNQVAVGLAAEQPLPPRPLSPLMLLLKFAVHEQVSFFSEFGRNDGASSSHIGCSGSLHYCCCSCHRSSCPPFQPLGFLFRNL